METKREQRGRLLTAHFEKKIKTRRNDWATRVKKYFSAAGGREELSVTMATGPGALRVLCVFCINEHLLQGGRADRWLMVLLETGRLHPYVI